jgi:hypothetical protein
MSTDQTQFDIIVETADSAESSPDRKVMAMLNQKISEAVRAAQRSGKKSKVALKLEITAKPDGRLYVSAAVDATLPNPPINTAQLFADGMGNLLTSDPRQGRLLEVKPNRRATEGEN